MGLDIVNSHELRRVILASATTADGTLAAQIDTKGYQGIVAFLLNIGVVGAADASNYLVFEAWESNDDGVADPYTQITDDYRYVTPLNVTTALPHGNGEFVINNVALADTDHMFGVMLYKRYIEIRVNETGTFSGTITLNALLGGARETIVAHRT